MLELNMKCTRFQNESFTTVIYTHTHTHTHAAAAATTMIDWRTIKKKEKKSKRKISILVVNWVSESSFLSPSVLLRILFTKPNYIVPGL